MEESQVLSRHIDGVSLRTGAGRSIGATVRCRTVVRAVGWLPLLSAPSCPQPDSPRGPVLRSRGQIRNILSVLRVLRHSGYKLASEAEFTKASLWVLDAPGTLIVSSTVLVCVEQRDKIMSKRTVVSTFLVTLIGSFFLVTLLQSFWPSDRRASGQEAATAAAQWTVNAEVQRTRTVVDREVGAGQGVTRFGDRLYVYGDLVFARPRVGVIKEFDLELRPTGRSVRLMRQGKPLLIHPTGLTRHEPWGTFLGDTVHQKARIYRLDWEQAWKDGNLDRAVLGEIDDDAAINGTRPVFVSLGGKTYLATADYGDVHPEIRLYDPDRLLAAGRSSAPGVVVHRVLCGPFNQNLHWDESLGHLICIQNVTAGSGWRLDRLDLARGVADGRAHGPGVRVRTLTFSPRNELEGFLPIAQDMVLFVVASREETLVLGRIREATHGPARAESTAGHPSR
jgi:hypothetical protein